MKKSDKIKAKIEALEEKLYWAEKEENPDLAADALRELESVLAPGVYIHCRNLMGKVSGVKFSPAAKGEEETVGPKLYIWFKPVVYIHHLKEEAGGNVHIYENHSMTVTADANGKLSNEITSISESTFLSKRKEIVELMDAIKSKFNLK